MIRVSIICVIVGYILCICTDMGCDARSMYFYNKYYMDAKGENKAQDEDIIYQTCEVLSWKPKWFHDYIDSLIISGE